MSVRRVLFGILAAGLVTAIQIKSSAQAPPPQTTKPVTATRPAGTPARPPQTAAAQPAAPAVSRPPTAAAFKTATDTLFDFTCSECHTSPDPEGGFDLEKYRNVASLAADRDQWELVLYRLKAREMPPADVDRPEEEISKLVHFLEAEFARADAALKPDPGRVTARRLNRAEYTNTIRDLLAVDFRADKNFPTDDSGEGFDNIGDVLTVSPVLMEKYLSAAARIAQRAVAAEPLPKPIEVEYSLRFKNLRRLDPSNVEATHRLDFDADYELRIGLPGERPATKDPAKADAPVDAKPVTMGIWLDGKLIKTIPVETKPSGLVYFNPYSEEKVRVTLPEGDHSLRLGFIGDDFVKTLPKEKIFNDKENKWIGSMTIVGPFPSTEEPASRKRVLVCDPKTGTACVDRIISTLARRAYRRPVNRLEVAALKKFVTMAQADGLSVEQGIGVAIQAMLVSPHFLFHIERDLYPNDPSRMHRITDVELASRLSYFLWNSMPDDQLLSLAERGQLSTPAVFDAQVKRMLADPKSLALAENFAGQWLEIRNLDSIKPDPQKFPAWTPELREAMKTETRLFFDSMLRENRPISEFVTARYTFLNELLAKFYGIDGVSGPDFRRVELTTEERGGVLGHGSVLAVSSYPTRTSVVIRGKYILQNILGTPPPPPPADVPALDEELLGTSASLRQQMEKHRTNSICASCHSRMDPLGFALENYDAIGKWRTKDGNFPVDASGVLPSGKSFTNPAEMRKILGDMRPDLTRTLTEKLLIYSLGRGLERYDKPTIRAITKKVGDSGYGFQSLIQEITRSLPFQSRRAEGVSVTPGTK
jgi:mono/diheme cytochrome c family protein